MTDQDKHNAYAIECKVTAAQNGFVSNSTSMPLWPSTTNDNELDQIEKHIGQQLKRDTVCCRAKAGCPSSYAPRPD